MLNEYRKRRDNIHAWLTAHPGIKCVKPNGAFYLFPDISALLSPDGVKTSAEFAQALLEKEHVAVTPGEGFDAPGYLRISYATSMEQLREGATRILRFAESLQPAKAERRPLVSNREPRRVTTAHDHRYSLRFVTVVPSWFAMPANSSTHCGDCRCGASSAPTPRRSTPTAWTPSARAIPLTSSSSPRTPPKSRPSPGSCNAAARAARRPRRRHRLHRRRRADARRRRPLDGADEPHPRDRRDRTCSPSSNRT